MTLQAALGDTDELSFLGGNETNPVVGLDVSKGESQVQAFLDKANRIEKALVLNILLMDLSNLLNFLRN